MPFTSIEEIKQELNKIEQAIILIVDQDGLILNCEIVNEYKMLSSVKSIVNTSVYQFTGEHVPLVNKVKQNIRKVLKTRQPINDTWEYLLEFKRYVRIYPYDEKRVILLQKKDPFLNPI